MSKVWSSVAAGFVAAYGLWEFQRLQSTDKLPHTFNSHWDAATFKRNSAKERVAAEPIALNPGRNALA